jgi:hypothetical protein
MSRYSTRLARIVAVGSALILLSIRAAPASLPTTTDVRTNEVAPNVHMLSVPTANAIVVVDEAGCLYAGPQMPSLINAARALAGDLHRQFRWAVMMEDDFAPQRRDGGWGETGALTITHESLYTRMKGSQPSETATALPVISFSNVLQLWLKTEEIHLIHDQRGYSNSDTIVHVEKAGMLYTSNLFTSDGYPAVRLDRGGSVSQLIDFARFMIRNYHNAVHRVEPIVPGRGPVATMRDLQDYSAMLIAIHESIGDLVKRSFTLERILALEPTKPFDARWGRGPVSPTAFTVQVYESFKKDLQQNAPTVQKSHDHLGAALGVPGTQ